MLFVFDLAGSLLAFNDDSSGLESFASVNLSAGDYLLGIDQFALNYGGNLSGFANATDAYYEGNYIINLREATVGVPEPASLALLGIGLAGLGAMRRRKSS